MTSNFPHDRVSLTPHESARGNLYAGEVGSEIPFEIKRFYVIRDVPVGESRGAHAHKATEQAIFCLHGSCTLTLDDGTNKRTVTLDTAAHGMLLRPMVWHSMSDFSSDCVLLVVANTPYDESDYIREYQEFLSLLR